MMHNFKNRRSAQKCAQNAVSTVLNVPSDGLKSQIDTVTVYHVRFSNFVEKITFLSK